MTISSHDNQAIYSAATTEQTDEQIGFDAVSITKP